MMATFVAPVQAVDKVNINTTTIEQLQQVKCLGPKTAAAIVEYRKEHGVFEDVDDLLKVKGIGVKKLKKIKDDLTIGKEKHDNDKHHNKEKHEHDDD